MSCCSENQPIQPQTVKGDLERSAKGGPIVSKVNLVAEKKKYKGVSHWLFFGEGKLAGGLKYVELNVMELLSH